MAPDLHSLPAIEGAGHILQNGARRDSCDPTVAGAVACPDVRLPAGGADRHPDGGLLGDGLLLFWRKLRFRHSLLSRIGLRHDGHQGGMIVLHHIVGFPHLPRF